MAKLDVNQIVADLVGEIQEKLKHAEVGDLTEIGLEEGPEVNRMSMVIQNGEFQVGTKNTTAYVWSKQSGRLLTIEPRHFVRLALLLGIEETEEAEE